MTVSERRGGRRVARAAEVLRAEGPGALGLRTLQHLGLYRRLLVQAESRDDAPPAVLDRIACSRLVPGDLDDYRSLRPDQDPEEIRRRLEAGHACFVARWEGRLAAARWAGPRRVHLDYLDCDLRLADDAYCVYDLYVAPAFRRRNLPRALAWFTRAELRPAGYRRWIALLWPENRSAIRRARRKGNRFIGDLVRWRIGSLRRYRLTLEGRPEDPIAWLPPGTGRTRVLPPSS